MTRVDFKRYESYLDVTNFPTNWTEDDFVSFLKKYSEVKTSRVVIHKTDPLRATLVFEGVIDLQPLVQKLSGKAIPPGAEMPLEVKMCGEDSLKIQVATNPGQIGLQEEMRRTQGLKANDWMRKSYGNYATKYVLTYKTRDATIRAYEKLNDFIKEKGIPATVELFDTIPHRNREQHLSDSNESKLFNNLGNINNQHARNMQSMGGNVPMMTGGFGFAPSGQSIPLAPPVVRAEPAGNQPVVFVEYFTAKGTPYYFNMLTRNVQWEIPPANAAVVKPNFEPKNLPGYVQTIPANTKDVAMPKFTAKKGPPGCNVFIYNLPHDWTEKDIFLNFSPFGKMVNARVIIDPITKLPRGYGFASYDNQKSALKAVQTMEGFTVSGKRLQVSIKKDDFDFK